MTRIQSQAKPQTPISNPFSPGDLVRSKETGEVFVVRLTTRETITMEATTGSRRIVSDGCWHYDLVQPCQDDFSTVASRRGA